MEHGEEVKLCMPDSGDVLLSDQERVGGRITVEKCTWNAPESGDWNRLVQVVGPEWRSELVCSNQWR